MASIEIDFEVFKALTLRRESEATTYNDVLREILGLDSEPTAPTTKPFTTGAGCVFQGIHFPEGTEFRVTYKGRTHLARVNNGQWVDQNGHIRRSPSDAAAAITRTNVNGWRFWSFRRPGDSGWRKMSVLQEA